MSKFEIAFLEVEIYKTVFFFFPLKRKLLAIVK